MKDGQLPALEALKQNLGLEHQALLAGDIQKIEQLGEEKVRLLEEISKLPASRFEGFVVLRSDIVRNQELAESAISGMRRALGRVRAIIDVKSELKTYDSLGQKNQYRVCSGQRLSKRS